VPSTLKSISTGGIGCVKVGACESTGQWVCECENESVRVSIFGCVRVYGCSG
jgi:hypothetical protein